MTFIEADFRSILITAETGKFQLSDTSIMDVGKFLWGFFFFRFCFLISPSLFCISGLRFSSLKIYFEHEARDNKQNIGEPDASVLWGYLCLSGLNCHDSIWIFKYVPNYGVSLCN